ncbi:hypothetical protein ES702_03252 [subsurface metagenome]
MRQNLRHMPRVLILLMMVTSVVRSNEIDYCGRLTALIEKGDKATTEQDIIEADREFREYINSLGPQQILIAGRQYTQWAEKNLPVESWDTLEGPRALLDALLLFYTEKTGSRSLSPIIKIIQNKEQNARWREVLMWAPDLWNVVDADLPATQKWKLTKVFASILRDEKDDPRVRAMASDRLCEILHAEYDNIVSDDPAVERFRKKNPGVSVYGHLGKEIKILLQTVCKLKPIQESAKKHIQLLLAMTKDPQLDPFLKDRAIYALEMYQRTPLSEGKEEEITLRISELKKDSKEEQK